MKDFQALLVLCVLLACSLQAYADDPPADPKVAQATAEAARLKAEADLIAQQKALVAAKYGSPATAPTGAINNPEKFLAMGQWTLGAATDDVANKIAAAWATFIKGPGPGTQCAGGTLLITSVADRRQAAAAAKMLDQHLIALTSDLGPPAKAPAANEQRSLSLATGAAAITGAVGTLDSLVALFRSDYTFSDLSVTSDDLTLRVALASKITNPTTLLIDAIGSPRKTGYPLLEDYKKFDAARRSAASAYAALIAPLKTDAEKAKYADKKTLLDTAAAFDTSLTMPANGQIPLVTAALAQEFAGEGQCVIYTKFGGYNASLVTRKRLLSRNDEITAIAGGNVQYIFFNADGNIVASNLIRIDERVGGELTEIVKNAKKLSSSQQ